MVLTFFLFLGDYGDEFFICLEGKYGILVPRKVHSDDEHQNKQTTQKDPSQNAEVRELL